MTALAAVAVPLAVAALMTAIAVRCPGLLTWLDGRRDPGRGGWLEAGPVERPLISDPNPTGQPNGRDEWDRGTQANAESATGARSTRRRPARIS